MDKTTKELVANHSNKESLEYDESPNLEDIRGRLLSDAMEVCRFLKNRIASHTPVKGQVVEAFWSFLINTYPKIEALVTMQTPKRFTSQPELVTYGSAKVLMMIDTLDFLPEHDEAAEQLKLRDSKLYHDSDNMVFLIKRYGLKVAFQEMASLMKTYVVENEFDHLQLTQRQRWDRSFKHSSTNCMKEVMRLEKIEKEWDDQAIQLQMLHSIVTMHHQTGIYEMQLNENKPLMKKTDMPIDLSEVTNEWKLEVLIEKDPLLAFEMMYDWFAQATHEEHDLDTVRVIQKIQLVVEKFMFQPDLPNWTELSHQQALLALRFIRATFILMKMPHSDASSGRCGPINSFQNPTYQDNATKQDGLSFDQEIVAEKVLLVVEKAREAGALEDCGNYVQEARRVQNRKLESHSSEVLPDFHSVIFNQNQGNFHTVYYSGKYKKWACENPALSQKAIWCAIDKIDPTIRQRGLTLQYMNRIARDMCLTHPFMLTLMAEYDKMMKNCTEHSVCGKNYGIQQYTKTDSVPCKPSTDVCTNCDLNGKKAKLIGEDDVRSQSANCLEMQDDRKISSSDGHHALVSELRSEPLDTSGDSSCESKTTLKSAKSEIQKPESFEEIISQSSRNGVSQGSTVVNLEKSKSARKREKKKRRIERIRSEVEMGIDEYKESKNFIVSKQVIDNLEQEFTDTLHVTDACAENSALIKNLGNEKNICQLIMNDVGWIPQEHIEVSKNQKKPTNTSETSNPDAENFDSEEKPDGSALRMLKVGSKTACDGCRSLKVQLSKARNNEALAVGEFRNSKWKLDDYDKMRKKLEQVEKRSKKLESDNSKMKKTISALSTEAEENKSLRKDFDEQKAVIQRLTARNERLENENDVLSKECKNKTNACNKLSKDVRDLERRFTQYKEAMKPVLDENQQLNGPSHIKTTSVEKSRQWHEDQKIAFKPEEIMNSLTNKIELLTQPTPEFTRLAEIENRNLGDALDIYSKILDFNLRILEETNNNLGLLPVPARPKVSEGFLNVFNTELQRLLADPDSDEELNEKKTCYICYENFPHKKSVYKCKMNHVVCLECGDKWRRQGKVFCPTCRKLPLVKAERSG